jgi:uncharacterized protein with PQ loop repeat
VDVGVPVIAGTISSVIFVGSYLPMLRKAVTTKDLGSYSLGQMLLANVGNVIHTVYVVHLPPGPVWLLHSFYLTSTALMLFWYLRYPSVRHRGREPGVDPASGPHASSGALGLTRS